MYVTACSMLFICAINTYYYAAKNDIKVPIPEVYWGNFEDLQGKLVQLFADVTKVFKKDKSIKTKKPAGRLSF